MNPGCTYTPDPRDHGYLASKHLDIFGAEDIFSQSMNWGIGPILDQGYTQECLAFGSCGILAAEPFQVTPPDPERLYAEMCAIDGRVHEPQDTGSNLHAALTVLQKRGLISSYLWMTSATQAWQYILNEGPVGIAIPWTMDMELLRDDGTLNVPSKLNADNIVGGHFLFLPGVRNDLDSGMHRFRGVNSRSTAWGQGGKFWLNFGELDTLLHYPGSACVAFTKTKFSAK